MKSNTRRGLVLIGLVIVVALIALKWRSWADVADNASVGEPPRETAARTSDTAVATAGQMQTRDSAPADVRPDNETGAPARNESWDTENAGEFRNAPPSTTLTAFEAEAQILGPGGRGISIDASSAVLMNRRFEGYMDALATQASREPLAADLTKLYRGSATDGARSLDGVSVRRVVCGLKVCLASGTALSNDALKPWQDSFNSNTSAPTYDSMAVQITLRDGSVEFRMVFGTDPTSRAIYPKSGAPGRR